MDRRRLLKQSLALGGMAGLSACAATPQRSMAGGVPIEDIPPPLPPIRAHIDRIFDVRCCLRPFRTIGPNLGTERMGDTLVVHNYGHGGSGWSLSWGSADIAVQKAMSVAPKQIAVVGCGIIGLTSALLAQRAGANVTIYAREMLPRTRSVRANGSWTPDSRITLAAAAGPDFGALWERMARYSWSTYRAYLGLPGRPVDFCDQYILSDEPRDAARADEAKDEAAVRARGAWTGPPDSSADFGDYSDRIRDITPGRQVLPPGVNPFPVKYAARTSNMFFNFGAYGHLLLSDFFQAGGRFEAREFHHPSELAQLKEKVVINCPGYAAKDLWKDTHMVPVRGQTGWLIPQPEVHYGISYNHVSVLSKSDGVMVQMFEGGDLKGYGDSMEVPNRAETERAVRIIEALYARFPAPPAA